MKSFDDVENYLIEKMNARGVPGFQVAIVQGDQIAYSKTFGYANIEKQIPVTLKTIFRVASVSMSYLWVAGAR
jgi:CubicO group peptidase (beta-lactamase class C family)